jgi:hypothetical protein
MSENLVIRTYITKGGKQRTYQYDKSKYDESCISTQYRCDACGVDILLSNRTNHCRTAKHLLKLQLYNQ